MKNFLNKNIFFSPVIKTINKKRHQISAVLNPEKIYYSIKRSEYDKEMSFSETIKKYPSYREIYRYMHHFYVHLADAQIRKHRMFYKNEMRGFGEDAMHAMWWHIFSEFRPKIALEIGVYRGQIITLWGLISRMQNFKCEVHGISPFTSCGDMVSTYLDGLNYEQDVIKSNSLFKLPEVHLKKAYSNDPEAIKYINSKKWDLIYIDGNHDYDVAFSDYQICTSALADGGLLIMDDSSLYSEYKPPSFAFAGHPGPSAVVRDFAMKELKFLGGVGHNNIFQKRL
jgi:hypothetical protein